MPSFGPLDFYHDKPVIEKNRAYAAASPLSAGRDWASQGFPRDSHATCNINIEWGELEQLSIALAAFHNARNGSS